MGEREGEPDNTSDGVPRPRSPTGAASDVLPLTAESIGSFDGFTDSNTEGRMLGLENVEEEYSDGKVDANVLGKIDGISEVAVDGRSLGPDEV